MSEEDTRPDGYTSTANRGLDQTHTLGQVIDRMMRNMESNTSNIRFLMENFSQTLSGVNDVAKAVTLNRALALFLMRGHYFITSTITAILTLESGQQIEPQLRQELQDRADLMLQEHANLTQLAEEMEESEIIRPDSE
jgi:hypothetical protein